MDINLESYKEKWTPLLAKPDWYLTVVPDWQLLQEEFKKKSEQEKDAAKKILYDFFEFHISRGDIALDDAPPDTDAERKPIDAVIIHHTSNLPGMSRDRLSGVELLRLYAPYFYEPKNAGDAPMKGRPIYSGHFRTKQGARRQVFWPYHWFVRQDGSAEQLLEDHEIGWQAGNWDVNCRSVAICFDGDFEHARPSDAELNAAADIIKKYYAHVPHDRIFGHREINLKTTCPSQIFLSDTAKHQHGWKEDLISLL